MAKQPQTTQTKPTRGGQERVQDQGASDQRDELTLGRAQGEQADDAELDDEDDLDDEEDVDDDEDEDEEA